MWGNSQKTRKIMTQENCMSTGLIEAVRDGVACASCARVVSIEEAAQWDGKWYCAEHERALFRPAE
jgi:hypothetical protein